MKINRILAAVDDSDFTSKVVQMALAMSKSLNAQLGLVSVVDPTPLVMSADNVVYPPEMITELAASAQEMLENLKKELGDSNVLLFSPQGNPREMIIETAHDWDADLIIIGTHGRTGLMHLVMGSVAESVIRHSNIPVLVVPSKQVD